MYGGRIAHLDQLGYVVPDIRAAMQHWLEVLGVGPFFVMEDVAIEGAYEGDRPVRVLSGLDPDRGSGRVIGRRCGDECLDSHNPFPLASRT